MNPSTLQWNISLFKCQENDPFPFDEENNSTSSKKDRMVQCEECNDWFHRGCVAVEEALFFRHNIQSGHVRSADLGNNHLLLYCTKKAS